MATIDMAEWVAQRLEGYRAALTGDYESDRYTHGVIYALESVAGELRYRAQRDALEAELAAASALRRG